MTSTASQLRVLSFNCWGLKFVSSDRSERIRAIGNVLAGESVRGSQSSNSSDQRGLDPETDLRTNGHCRWDVVCLQEVWVQQDGAYLLQRAKEGGLAHGRWFHSAALGAGLMIIARFPIKASRMLTYPLGGNPLHFIEGDFFVGKGAASATLDCGARGLVEVITSHLHAPGGDGGPEWLRSHRLAQAWELSSLAQSATDKGRPVIICGDFNTLPEGLVIQLLIARGGLGDAWPATHKTPRTPYPSTDEEAIESFGVTCDSRLCSYTAGKKISEFAIRGKGKRLDYILYRGLGAIDSNVVMTEKIGMISLSDHFGVEATLSFDTASDKIPVVTTDMLERTRDALSQQIQNSYTTAKFQLQIFLFCILLIPGLPVAASFQPLKFLNWIFVLLGILTGVAGATFLYLGFLFGRWERKALRNVIWEIDNERSS